MTNEEAFVQVRKWSNMCSTDDEDFYDFWGTVLEALNRQIPKKPFVDFGQRGYGLYCPHCGNRVDKEYCGNCGQKYFCMEHTNETD